VVESTREIPVQVNGKHLLPIGERKLLDWVHDLDTGIADQDVDAAEGLGGLFDRGVDLLLAGHVDSDADRLGAARLQFGRGGIGRLLVEVGDHDLRALLGEEERDLLADTAGRAGDESDLVLELHGISLE
jgi:hypothetical protein